MGIQRTSETWTTSSARKRLYKTARWQRLREDHLRRHPLCQCPHHKGKDPAAVADVVDHITPHRGDARLFHDPRNLQSMQKQCHDRFKQQEEKGGAGFWRGCSVNGEPLDNSHPWHE